jgi:PAN domain
MARHFRAWLSGAAASTAMMKGAPLLAALVAQPAAALDPCGFNCDLPGNDIAAFSGVSADQCAAACRQNGRCNAWTWVKPGYQGPAAVCYLKNPTPRARGAACCISGYVLR